MYFSFCLASFYHTSVHFHSFLFCLFLSSLLPLPVGLPLHIHFVVREWLKSVRACERVRVCVRFCPCHTRRQQKASKQIPPRSGIAAFSLRKLFSYYITFCRCLCRDCFVSEKLVRRFEGWAQGGAGGRKWAQGCFSLWYFVGKSRGGNCRKCNKNRPRKCRIDQIKQWYSKQMSEIKTKARGTGDYT